MEHFETLENVGRCRIFTTEERSEGTQRQHAYPGDLSSLVRERWERHPEDCGNEGLPDGPVLEALLSTCYQASLLREEERPVVFRLIFADPTGFPESDGPPDGLHRLEFEEPRAFDEHELRRLSPAADFDRSLIGVSLDEEGRRRSGASSTRGRAGSGACMGGGSPRRRCRPCRSSRWRGRGGCR